jgi:hypothetical protein
MSIKSFVEAHAATATQQADEYVQRVAMSEEYISDSPIEKIAKGALKAREIGWQALHLVVCLPELLFEEEK